jgi:hypothetical protein
MSDQITISKTLSIRDCGYDENWLQEQIANDPSILNLGDLEVVRREKQQSSGGKLDILLKDPEDDTMYEVEVMLGATDESHIIRTIEYWDLERKRWPQRQHFAVLVAENITRRFFNVIQLFSLSIPIIAIQANIIEANGSKILHFTKILDTYEEPEDEQLISNETHDESWWRTKSAWTLETAQALFGIVSQIYGVELNYRKNHIPIHFNNKIHFGFNSLRGNKSHLWFWVNDSHLPQVAKILDEKSISYVTKRNHFNLTVDKEMIEKNTELFREIATLVKHSWQS